LGLVNLLCFIIAIAAVQLQWQSVNYEINPLFTIPGTEQCFSLGKKFMYNPFSIEYESILCPFLFAGPQP